MSRTLHLFGTDWCAMMVPIQVIRWYRMQCYDGTDSCAIVVPIRRYCQLMSQIWNFMSMEYVGLAIGVISVVLSCICYLMTSNFALSITQLVVGLVLTIQSFVAARNTKCQILKINKKIDELRVSYIDSPEYLYAMVDAEDHVIFCVRRDGTIDWTLGVPQPIRKEIERLEKKIDEQK